MLARPSAQPMKSRDMATIAPARTASPRVARRLGAEANANTPAMASGTAARNPASAADGKGTSTPRKTSYTVQTISPAVQVAAEAANRAQASLTRPALRQAATPQLTAASAEATASP